MKRFGSRATASMFIRVAAAMVLAGAAWLATRLAAALPAGIASPDHGVVCNPQRTICYDLST